MAELHAGDDALLERVGALADEVLWPSALSVDASIKIPTSHFDALSELGLFAMLAPRSQGGLGLELPVVRSVLRILGTGCGATAFAFAQHGGVVAATAKTANESLRERWLPRLLDRSLGGTAFAHVRRDGPAAVRATRIDGGWRIDGEAPWATSWGTAEVFSVAAISEEGALVWFLTPGTSSEALVASAPMTLVAFGATETVRLSFRGLVVPDEDVLDVTEIDRWREGDRRGAVRPNPMCLAVGDRALRELDVLDSVAADSVREAWGQVCERAHEASAEVDRGTDDIEGVARVRSETVFAVQALTTALMAAGGGRSAGLENPAQLLARQALFYVVQAQNADGRQATLDGLANRLAGG